MSRLRRPCGVLQRMAHHLRVISHAVESRSRGFWMTFEVFWMVCTRWIWMGLQVVIDVLSGRWVRRAAGVVGMARSCA